MPDYSRMGLYPHPRLAAKARQKEYQEMMLEQEKIRLLKQNTMLKQQEAIDRQERARRDEQERRLKEHYRQEDFRRQEAKFKKDMLDFYRTSREYLGPKEAFRATKEAYPEFSPRFEQADEPTLREKDIQGRVQMRGKEKTDYRAMERDNAKSMILAKIGQHIEQGADKSLIMDMLTMDPLMKKVDINDPDIASALENAPAMEEQEPGFWDRLFGKKSFRLIGEVK